MDNAFIVPTQILRDSYLHYTDSRNPTAQPYVTLPEDGLELGIVSAEYPEIASAISAMLCRSLESARCDKGGHLPPVVVKRVQNEIISPESVAHLWGVTGHRFVLCRPVDDLHHEIVATILVGRSKDTIFFFTGRYNNLRHSTIAQDVDFNQPDNGEPSQQWFDRFAMPDIVRFKPARYHHIANFVVSPLHRRRGYAGTLLSSIVRYYSREYIELHGLPIVHSQYLLCGRGFWQIGDPPWMARMKKLGFFRRWGAESFFIEQEWAPLPKVVIGGKPVSNREYNDSYDMPACYEGDAVPHPSDTHMFDRVPEVLRLARHPKAKLQYFQAMFDFV